VEEEQVENIAPSQDRLQEQLTLEEVEVVEQNRTDGNPGN
jgi:hypothetical protein